MSVDIQAFARTIHLWAQDHGFWEGDTTKPEFKAMKIALMHSELSEALEDLRVNKDQMIDNQRYSGDLVELADCVIRILDYVEHYFGGAIFEEVLRNKMEYNRRRPHKHGKEF